MAERYIEALILDLEKSLPLTTNRPLQSIFIGGGTPSLIAPNLLDRFLSRANDLFSFANDIEITLEANPGTVDVANFKAYRQSGVNRLSMGIQSFDDSLLKRLRASPLPLEKAQDKDGFSPSAASCGGLFGGSPQHGCDKRHHHLEDLIYKG